MKKFLIFLILTISFAKLVFADSSNKLSSVNNDMLMTDITTRQGLPDKIITFKKPPFQYDSGELVIAREFV